VSSGVPFEPVIHMSFSWLREDTRRAAFSGTQALALFRLLSSDTRIGSFRNKDASNTRFAGPTTNGQVGAMYTICSVDSVDSGDTSIVPVLTSGLP
jgi:hypothetical protein